MLKVWLYIRMLYLMVSRNNKITTLKHCFYYEVTDWITE